MTNTPTTFFGWIIFLIQQYHGYYLQGLLTTLETSLAGTICGCFLGFLVGIIQATDIRAQDNMIKKILLGIPWVIAKIYVTIFRGTPMLVQIMLGFGLMGSLSLPTFQVGILQQDLGRLIPGIIVISLNSGAYMAEIVRAGIEAVPLGQKEAAYSLGIRPRQAMATVILPQALRNILPAVGNEFVTIIKDSSLLYTIGVMEVFNGAQTVANLTYQTISPMLFVALYYFVVTFVVSRLLVLFEKKLGKGYAK